jgi:molybdate-binding protein/DNA-binding transcriptional regulator YhcF (GntR family)
VDEAFLYQRIAEDIRQEILAGRLQPGDRLPSIRSLTQRWDCTPGTVQRAYQELARQGLVAGQAGKGTHVSRQIDLGQARSGEPLRRASIVHHAEAFLLEALTAGYALNEVQQALDLAIDRWRSMQQAAPERGDPQVLRFSGSHDMAVIWLSAHMAEIAPGASLHLDFTGSLGGLMALAGGRAELAGCHLWDTETDSYNEPFIRKLFPGKRMLLVRLAERRMGLITPPGNPLALRGVADLARDGVVMVNRQSGSGTRVWLDAALHRLGIDPAALAGYADEKTTHSEVARAVAEGRACAGIALESAAAAFGLGFVPLVEERYELVAHKDQADQPPLCTLLAWLASDAARERLGNLSGYDISHAGEQRVIEPV